MGSQRGAALIKQRAKIENNTLAQMRFLLPAVPSMSALCALGLEHLRKLRPNLAKVYLCGVLLIHFAIAVYLLRWHQAGPVLAIDALGQRLVTSNATGLASVLWFTPCHAGPWTAYLHPTGLQPNIRMYYLPCEPPGAPNSAGDVAEEFFKDPARYLRKNTCEPAKPPPAGALRSCIPAVSTEGQQQWLIAFDSLMPQIWTWMTERASWTCWTFFHAHFPTHSNAGQKIVLCVQAYAQT